ncbi:hypothetical protein D3C81_1733710 [compost metagenome]
MSVDEFSRSIFIGLRPIDVGCDYFTVRLEVGVRSIESKGFCFPVLCITQTCPNRRDGNLGFVGFNLIRSIENQYTGKGITIFSRVASGRKIDPFKKKR